MQTGNTVVEAIFSNTMVLYLFVICTTLFYTELYKLNICCKNLLLYI